MNDSGEDQAYPPALNANLSANASPDDVEIFRLVSIDYEFIRIQVIFYTLRIAD